MTRLSKYLTADTSFGRGGAIGEVIQRPAGGDVPAQILGIITNVWEAPYGWAVDYVEIGDTSGSYYIAPADSVDFATAGQLAIVGRRMARMQVESLKGNAR